MRLTQRQERPVQAREILEGDAAVAHDELRVLRRDEIVVGEDDVGALAAEEDLGADEVIDVARDARGRELQQAPPRGPHAAAEDDEAVLDAERRRALALGHELEEQELLAEQDPVAAHELDGRAQAAVDAVSPLERREDVLPAPRDDARVPRRQEGIVEGQIGRRAAEVDRAVGQRIRAVVGAVVVEPHEPKVARDVAPCRDGQPTGAGGAATRRSTTERSSATPARRDLGQALDATRRVPHPWQNDRSSGFSIPQLPHSIMRGGLSASRIDKSAN